ncbi:LPXTG cell wall anchor domain-containing protein [Bifidobacterium sp. ESL0690]|uniref:LPXTG cell wall anchor domain-containing protein n=1 Tax=Bifidobacterium sp. ESL0690 TaxID=2983214 RepID=UPI0023F8CDBB|nr:LPXTG cell wall anchor domain-containing protein [Bifidobacterium sp. ESL0690]WEV46999.1 LPXTG cell wall anchor domain-containing protein [Bifidobacterium sp. ESL0690]
MRMQKSKSRASRLLACSLAGAMALVTLLPGTAYAGGGGGSAGGGGGGTMEVSQQWAYKDNNDGGFGGYSMSSITAAFSQMGVTMGIGTAVAQQALDEANTNCTNRFHEAHPGQGDGDCRVVAVGTMTGPSKEFSGQVHNPRSVWTNNWATQVAGGTYSNAGVPYTTADIFADQPGTSVNSLVDQYASDDVSIVVIMLNKFEPKIPEYDLTVSTSQQAPSGLVVGATNTIRDTIHASNNGSPIFEDVNADVTLHYAGQPDGYVSVEGSQKTGGIHNNGDSSSPSFSPSDLGMTHWQEGQYWFDVSVGKQGKMSVAASHMGSADASEKWYVSSSAPAAPVKNVQEGTSTNNMVNTTTIESDTGRGGYEMHFKDAIAPNGVNYSVSDMKVTDTNANSNVSSQFTMNWDQSANAVTADRSQSAGEMPLNHVFKFAFKVTVHNPNVNMVGDTASVAWNRKPFVDTAHYQFPTRNPNPDKAWTTDPNEALATADPNHTNHAGSDGRTFVPGDRVSSVVNGTLPKGLVEDLSQYSLTDDWSDASRYVNFPNANAKVYVDGIDRTADFTVTTSGSKTTATARPSILAGSAHQPADRSVKLVLDGTFKLETTATDAISMTNSGDEKWNGQDASTNRPPVLVHSPNPDKAWVKDGQEAQSTSDHNHTNAVAADNKTYVTGDDAVVVVNGTLPKNLAKDLNQYAIIDDWSQAAQYVDFPNNQARVYVDGVDRSAGFSIETSGHVTTATAKPAILAGSGKQARDRRVKLVLTGVMRKDVDAHTTATIVNKGSEQWNGKTAATNMPQVHVWSPNPDKSWVRLNESGRWKLVIDPAKSNATGADNLTFLDGDQLGAVVNLPITNPSVLEYGVSKLSLTDDYAKADYLVDPQAISKMRIYMAPAGTSSQSSVDAINNIAGSDITRRFNVTQDGTRITATAKADWLADFSRHVGAVQITMFVPFVANYGNGEGIAKVREDFHKNPGDELAFGTDPAGADLLNTASILINRQGKDTNLPKIYGYLPPVKKDVVSEASQGGSQDSVDGKVVYPGQKLEYDLDTQPHLPSLAYVVKTIAFTDRYDRYLKPDKQTLELMDLNSGRMVPKSKYITRWDDAAHEVVVSITDMALISQWQAGGTPRLQLRFEGTVSADASTDHRVGNQWMLTLNNSVTPSNEVFNIPPALNPVKHDFQSSKQGDPAVSIDGKTLLLGDTGNYVIDLDATQVGQAYNVWKLGVVDDFDEEYLKVDPTGITVIGDDGRDYTAKFNIQVLDGVLYVFAKRVDTFVAASGETVNGDPQPTDLKAYAASDSHDPLADPAIDQTLLGQCYHITLPYVVQKITDGYVVKNKVTQVENNVRKKSNQVSNPLKPINPAKDVVVMVGGESVNGSSIYKGGAFLYRLDSSVLPANRAYTSVEKWSIVDKLDPDYDEYTGQWAVYATRDLHAGDGSVLAGKGHRIAGNGFDSSRLGGDMFTLQAAGDGTLSVVATPAYRALVSADSAHEQGWCAYLQVRRLKATDRHENKFSETMNDKFNESNVVWTRTPELTPSLHIEKWDKSSGWSTGDRDEPDDSLLMTMSDADIVFTVTNTSKSENGHGAVFRAKDLEITDTTISGDGAIASLKYPRNWSTLVLRPGDHVDVIGTLKDVSFKHRDRAKVTGLPLEELPAVDRDPWGEDSGNGIAKRDASGIAATHGSGSASTAVSGFASAALASAFASAAGFASVPAPSSLTSLPGSALTLSSVGGSGSGSGSRISLGKRGVDKAASGRVIRQDVQLSPEESGFVGMKSFTQGMGKPSAEIDGNVMSVMRPVASNMDDWNGRRETLVISGASITLLLLVAGAFLFGAILLEVFKGNRYCPRHR